MAGFAEWSYPVRLVAWVQCDARRYSKCCATAHDCSMARRADAMAAVLGRRGAHQRAGGKWSGGNVWVRFGICSSIGLSVLLLPANAVDAKYEQYDSLPRGDSALDEAAARLRLALCRLGFVYVGANCFGPMGIADVPHHG